MYTFLVDHIFGHIPVWIWPFVAGIGFTGYFFTGILSRFPQLDPWAPFVKPVCFVIFVAGVFMLGAGSVASIMQQQILAAEARAKAAEEATVNGNNQLASVLASNQQANSAHTGNVSKDITKDRNEINKGCNVDDTAWNDYNHALTNPETK